jgi:hypothetical protein
MVGRKATAPPNKVRTGHSTNECILTPLAIQNHRLVFRKCKCGSKQKSKLTY